ncbi:MAG: gamma-glutamylcyclotransferase [Bacteroidetes bacterium]|jgi:gamma-glutamylcyclotransferase (GGCT)/AIG2-like uncharacterized protein YtfP|nr:gamma-glutamylcyclotransferase [Bacteroidota bacterium]
MPDRLFVYGTLKPGEPNHDIVRSIEGTWEEAIVHGHLLKPGPDTGMSYPGVILDKSKGPVEGYLFTSDELPKHWDAIDRFEGREYQRVATDVTLRDGRVVEAYIYELKISEAF